VAHEVIAKLGEVMLPGLLSVPSDARGLVLFAHGSGSSRLSPRNAFVARVLQERGFATFLFDLLTEREDMDYSRRFDVELLAQRLLQATRWAGGREELRGLPLGYFGASTGAAAALMAAAELGREVGAVVSRGGRTDLAEPSLDRVLAPTLLIVGELDLPIRAVNECALSLLRCVKELVVVEGASHLFEEPGALERVAILAAGWFERHLARASWTRRQA